MNIFRKFSNISEQTKSIISSSLLFIFIVVSPALAIWAFNSILSVIAVKTIPLTIKTWFAMLIIMAAFGWRSSIKIFINRDE